MDDYGRKNGYAFVSNEWIFDDRIKTELRLLIYISSLTAKEGYAYASNEHLAKEFKTTTVTISRQLNKLIDLGYLSVDYKRSGNIITSRYLRLTNIVSSVNNNDNSRYQNCKPPLTKMLTAVNKNVKDNITSNNTINNNNNVHSENERKTKNKNIGVYNYDYSERHKGLDYESNVKIDESYSDTDFGFLAREKTDETLPNNHYLIMLKKELGFNIFWKEYKKKVGRKKAKDAFMKLKYKDVVKIIATVKEYVSVNSDEQYRKHPLTYLNGRCWEDDLTSKKLVLPHNWRYMRLNDEQRKLLTPEQLKSYDRHVNKGEVEGHFFKPAPMIYE